MAADNVVYPENGVVANAVGRNPWLRHFASDPLIRKPDPYFSTTQNTLMSVEEHSTSLFSAYPYPEKNTPFVQTIQKLTKKKKDGTEVISSPKAKGRGKGRRSSESSSELIIKAKAEPEADLAEKMRNLAIVRRKSSGSPEAEPGTSPTIVENELQQQNLYKTELCRSYEETGTCRYGLKCQFAHGRVEVRPVMRHPKYKTEMCKTWQTIGTCPYGTRCRFIHPKDDDEFGSGFVQIAKNLVEEKDAAEPEKSLSNSCSRLKVFAEIASSPSRQDMHSHTPDNS